MTTKVRVKNPYGKMVSIEEAYFTFKSGEWEWKVRKLYRNPENTLKDPYARAFCGVKSPYTLGKYELGDVYVTEIPGLVENLRSIAREAE